MLQSDTLAPIVLLVAAATSAKAGAMTQRKTNLMSAEKMSQPAASLPAGDLSALTHALTLHLDGPIPVAWQTWRKIHVGPTLIDLLETMETEASRASFWPQSEIAIAEAKTVQEESPSWPSDGALDDSRIQQAAQERNQALRLG